jgi:hypothetical protein
VCLGNYDEGDLAALELKHIDDLLVVKLIQEIRDLRDAVSEREIRIEELQFDMARLEERV